MSVMLNDVELRSLLGKVIVDGDPTCLRPNSYVLRLGSVGEFLNTNKEFEIGQSQKKKGLRIQPGHSVGVTSLETLDFRRETVHNLYPDQDLHAFLTPTTDLSREGIVASATQVDAGFYGTLNWTLTNTSSEERKFVHKERIYRITIFRLEAGEKPEHLYSGSYQSQLGYIRSRRTGAPIGMKDSEWEDAFAKGGPEDLLDNLIRSGYPWHILGSRLKEIDQQFKSVTEEYADVHDSITELSGLVNAMRERQAETSETVRKVLREEAGGLQNRWLIGAGSLFLALAGIGLTASSSSAALEFLRGNGSTLGIGLIIVAVVTLIILARQK